MTTTSTPHPAVVALPANAVTAEEWQPREHDDRFYRCFEGEERHIGDSIRVWTHGTQNDDGQINDGTVEDVFGAPGISVDGLNWEDGIGSETARQLADVLITAADEIDRWSVVR